MRVLLYACSLAIASATLSAQMSSSLVPLTGMSRNVLTNQGVAMLARAGYSEGFILDMIVHKQTQFDVSSDGLVWLAGQGLSERVIRTMVANERKEERTAVVPGPVAVQTPQGAPYMTTQTLTLEGRRQGRHIVIEMTVPAYTAPGSWPGVRSWDRDRWYVVPNMPVEPVNVPVIAANAR